jgi:aminoglycoside 2'-N-acetyltransferase I
VIKLRTAHTAELDAGTLEAARLLLLDVFEDDWTDDDWDHALGGMHVLLWERDELIGHASVVQRRLLHGGRALRTGYVEGVAIRGDRQRRGHGSDLMSAVERIIQAAYVLGALSSSEEARGLYRARGWKLWQGPSFRLTPSGIQRSAEEDGGLYVLAVTATLDLAGEITCDWRDGETW